METHPCVSEVAHMQEQHQQPQQQQQQSESVVNIKRVSLPFVSHGLIDTDMSKADDVSHILKQKLHHVETLVDGSTQLVNLSSMDNNCDSVVNIPKELILITLVSQEQALYNPKHALYRSTKSKDEKWAEIGNHVGWTGEWGGGVFINCYQYQNIHMFMEYSYRTQIHNARRNGRPCGTNIVANLSAPK